MYNIEMAVGTQITDNVNVKECELYDCLRFSMRLCRWAGVFPVDGLDKKDVTGLRFNLRSLYVIYHTITMIAQSVLTFLSTYHFFISDLELHKLTNVLFFTTGCISSMLLHRLARNWPKLMEKAIHIENTVSKIRSTKRIYRRNSRIVALIMILALLEHILSLIFKMNYIIVAPNKTQFVLEIIKLFFTKNAPFVFDFFAYTEWKALLYEVPNIQATFLWNFPDAMTICISLYLISYFKDLNNIIAFQEKQKEIDWNEIRIYYSYLVELVKEINTNICYLILLSFFTNVFFICVQLFYLIKTYDGPTHLVYFSYSFLFLFIRASVTSLLATNINTNAYRPMLVLQDVPTSEYTLDVQRFVRQIRYTTTALSGSYFYITRGMILTVIGTVVKYELVLLQFRLQNYE